MAYNFVDESGTIIPDTSVFQAEIEAEYQAVFGADLDPVSYTHLRAHETDS